MEPSAGRKAPLQGPGLATCSPTLGLLLLTPLPAWLQFEDSPGRRGPGGGAQAGGPRPEGPRRGGPGQKMWAASCSGSSPLRGEGKAPHPSFCLQPVASSLEGHATQRCR